MSEFLEVFQKKVATKLEKSLATESSIKHI